MIEPVPETLPPTPTQVPAPAEVPDAQKPRKTEEEQKFAHQLEKLIVKEQKDIERVKKIDTQRERKGWRREVRIGKKEEEKKKEEKYEEKKGHIIDITI